MTRLEKYIEGALCRRVKELDGKCIKLTGYKGIPDRLVLLPGGIAFFVELKSDKGELAEAQTVWRVTLNALGFNVYTCRSRAELNAVLRRYKHEQ